MALRNIILLLTLAASTLGQRPFYAGSRPIGYPQMEVASGGLGNRFGDGDNTTTTQRLPIEALGDRNLVDRLSKLPIDQQPFWLINWQALEANRRNPQTFQQRPSQFAQPFHSTDSGTVNSNSGTNTANVGSISAPNIPIPNTNSPNPPINPSSSLGDRNSDSEDINSVNASGIPNPANGISNSAPGDKNANANSTSTEANVNENSKPSLDKKIESNTSANANGATDPGIGIFNSTSKTTSVNENTNLSVGHRNKSSTSTNSANKNNHEDFAYENFSNSNEADDAEFEK